MKNKRKKLTAYALVAVLGLSFTAYPVHAEEEQPAIENNAEIQADARDLLGTENNAGSFNVTGGTSGTEWTYDTGANTLTFNTSGTYTIEGDGQETDETIHVAQNFTGTITIKNINAKQMTVENTATLTLMLDGTNTLSEGLIFADATTGSLTIDSQTDGSLTASSGDWGAGIGGGESQAGNNITINGGTVTATSTNAGIGGGYDGSASNITISGGTVNATSERGGAGIGGGYRGAGSNITINGGTVNATSSYGAGIGGGYWGSATNITIRGGTVTATGKNGGAGIGGGDEGSASDITINGGTVTATSGYGAGIGGGWNASASNIIIDGGSVKASSISVTPTDEAGNAVYLLKLENQSGVDEVTVDDKTFTRQGDHTDGDGAFYLYLTEGNHTITAPIGVYNAEWNGSNGFDISSSPTPAVTVESATASTVTVKVLDKQDVYGTAEYSLDNQNWQTSNEFTELDADTEYTVYARYQGNDTYGQSEAGSTKVKTMKDGNALVENSKPDSLTGVYGQKLSDISLPQGWTWTDNDTALSAGEQSYPARFDTAGYEGEYDFTDISGYDSTNHYVELNLTVNVSKADSTVTINTSSLDKEYDGTAVSNPNVEKTGSTKDVAFTWYQKDGDGWKELSSAPTDAGSYKVVASVEADDNYNGTSVELEFVISQTANEWTEVLSITGWTYGDKANVPTATAKYGTVTFTYSDTKDGIYTDTLPTNAGTWYVKATVVGNENYTGLEEIMSFEISKAVPEYSVPTDLTIEQGNSLSTLKLPDGFAWKDETQIADNLGKQTFKAVYTPEDTDNYQTVEMDITVNVVAKAVSADTTDKTQQTGVETGDSTNVFVWTALLMVSLAGAVSSVLFRRRKQR